MDSLINLFHAALALAPGERATFLQKACGDDLSAQEEVESLIEYHEQTGTFIDSPAYQAGAHLLMDDAASAEGQTIAHYQILSLLGEGGMGKVYLAQDAKLERRVALKVLSSLAASDPTARERLLREARATARLDHPNICAVYEVGEDKGHSYIAMQCIEGETLDARLKRGPMSCHDAIKIAIQVADALAEAHGHNVIHRDIKPSNIILTSQDQVKLLDFGLATSPSQTFEPIDEVERKIGLTQPGTVAGTIPYMSPEQVRAEGLDARTDIWSLGVILYEMLTRHQPFVGNSAADIRNSILRQKVPGLFPDLPEEVGTIIEKSLRKDRDDRYQTIAVMLSELRGCQQDTQESEIAKWSATPASSGQLTVRLGDGLIGINSIPGEGSIGIVREKETSGALSKIREHKWLASSLLITFIIITAVVSVGLYRFRRQQRSQVSAAPTRLHTMTIARLSSTGKAANAAISPDGMYVVHVLEEGGQQSLWLRQVSNLRDVQLSPASNVSYSGLIFSPDGNRIYFTVNEGNTFATLFQIPEFGGPFTKVIDDVDSEISFSPDGRQIAFLREYPLQKGSALLVANTDGTAERRLATRNGISKIFSSLGDGATAWSPDGKVIVCPVRNVDEIGRYMSLVEVLVADGSQKIIAPNRWWHVGNVLWLREGQGLLFTARERPGSPSQIYYLSYPGGNLRAITNELSDYASISLTADSKALAAVVSDLTSNIWTMPGNSSREARQITDNKLDGVNGLSWMRDGRIIYTSSVSGSRELWTMEANGTGQRQLTSDGGNNVGPCVSSDGRFVVFVSDRTGNRHIWRIDIDGSNPKQLTNGDIELFPLCLPAEQSVVYWTPMAIWKMSIDGEGPLKIIDNVGLRAISPDGKWIAADHSPRGVPDLAIYPLEGGEPHKIFHISDENIRWTPDGRALASIDSTNFANIISQPIEGGPPKRITDFSSERIFSFAWSPDGKQLAVARGTLTNDVVLIKDFLDQF